jgi:Kdo2-lipid IVA lauroyltransferase/acyltransferase
MTWRDLQFRLEAATARLALRALRGLGPVAASNLGGAVARTVGPLLPVSRVADVNLRMALPELDAAARRRVIIGVWENLGRTAAEMPHIASLRETQSGPGWEIAGAEIVRGLVAAGGPLIFVSGHIGNWEVLPAAFAAHGVRLSVFYRAAANPLVDQLILELRLRAVGPDVPQFAKGVLGARAAMAYLKGGGILGILADQKMNDGIAVPLFGHMAMTAPAAAVYALRFRCPVVPGYVQRLGPARFRLICEPPLALPDTGSRSGDTLALTAQINACLERWIRARPAEWLWLHRRWPQEVYR